MQKSREYLEAYFDWRSPKRLKMKRRRISAKVHQEMRREMK